MALEYSMYPQLVSGLAMDAEQLFSDSNYGEHYSLTALQTLATALGDGFYAENITLENDLGVYFYYTSGNSRLVTIIAGKTIPVLRSTSLGNTALLFTGYLSNSATNTYFNRSIAINVIDVSTETLLTTCYLHLANGTSGYANYLKVINASSNVKMLQAYENTYALANLIFYDDCIIMNQSLAGNPAGSSFGGAVIQLISDGVVHSTIYNSTIGEKSKINLTPFYAETLPNKEFKGVYVAERLTNHRIECNFSKNGVLYFSPGILNSSVSSNHTTGALLVISDEVQEVTQ